LHENLLTISGERKEERKDKGGTCRTERFYGRFQRTFSLPTPVSADKITAAYQDGVLTVVLPKAEEARPKQIPVNVN
jgi:HSP20 family protein